MPVPRPSAESPATPHTLPACAAPRRVLPVIVLAQLLGTSPWFAVNAVMPDLQRLAGWGTQTVGTLSAALQIGFIAGTLVFALLAVADRFSARRVFFVCACGAALCTLAAAASASSLQALLFWRVLTGVCLAGIYPVGMKLAALWFPQGLGAALGWLVGALVLGSASAHALRAWGLDVAGAAGAEASTVTAVFVTIAALCAAAGLAVLWLVPEPPARAGPSAGSFRRSDLASLWGDHRLRASAGGYFGHMWELYALWVLMPVVLATRLADSVAVSWASFLVLGAGALGCVGGGLLVRRWGSARVAGFQLATSAACCLAAPWMLQAPVPLFMAWLLLWGITVAGDSPQFSAMTAAYAPPAAMGRTLTLVNSIGFAISALSIELFVGLAASLPLAAVLPWLAAGPLLGLWLMRSLVRAPSAAPRRL